MDIGTISMRYAKALIKYAQENKAEDRLYEELTQLALSFSTTPQLRGALENPIIPFEKKHELICIAATNTMDKKPSDEFDRFIRMVLKQHRETLLQYMALAYIDLYHKLKHIAVGKLITAVPIDSKLQEKIRNIAGATVHARMMLETIVDPSIEGGVIFDINGYRLDASTATQLKRIKRQFIEKNKRIV